MNIYGYNGTIEELAISIGRQSDTDIASLLDLVSDELYKIACKEDKENLLQAVDCLDKASKLINNLQGLKVVK